MLYARINLRQTAYQRMTSSQILWPPVNIEYLNGIYKKYCQYKQFKSVMPIFDCEYRDPDINVHGYYHPTDSVQRLIAFSLIKIYDKENVEAMQFAWDYEEPELELGIKSLKHECAFYKEAGFKYLYLGGAEEYKSKIDGFEILGPA